LVIYRLLSLGLPITKQDNDQLIKRTCTICHPKIVLECYTWKLHR